MSSYVYVSNTEGDWAGIYVDGSLKYEGSTIPHFIWLKLLLQGHGSFNTTDEYEVDMEELGILNLPSSFSRLENVLF